MRNQALRSTAKGRDPGNRTPIDNRSHTLRESLQYLAARGFLGFLRILPYGVARPIAEWIGVACGGLIKNWPLVAEDNLRAALPELSALAKEQIIQDVFRNLGRVALALAKAPDWSDRNVREHVDFVGLEHFREGEARGRGVMLLTAHLGNWELGALAHGAVVGPIDVMVRPIENPMVDRLVEQRREARGNRVIRKRNAAREVLAALQRNGTVGILADQNTLPEEAVFVDFFGRPASANRGFARLALHSDAAVVPAFAWWDYESRRYLIEYGPAIELIRTGDTDADVIANTQRFQTVLEECIRRHPDQWLWIHRRWKTQPPPDA